MSNQQCQSKIQQSGSYHIQVKNDINLQSISRKFQCYTSTLNISSSRNVQNQLQPNLPLVCQIHGNTWLRSREAVCPRVTPSTLSRRTSVISAQTSSQTKISNTQHASDNQNSVYNCSFTFNEDLVKTDVVGWLI